MSVDAPQATDLSNSFTDIPSTSIASLAQNQRVQPRQVATGVTRGTWRINNTDGSYITIGVIPDTENEFGIAFFGADGQVIKKILALTEYLYDPDTGKNIMQEGKLPDSSYG